MIENMPKMMKDTIPGGHFRQNRQFHESSCCFAKITRCLGGSYMGMAKEGPKAII
jgi:hypothetical protein